MPVASVAMHKTRIRQIVSRQVVTVAPQTPADEAISIMAQARISCLVIAEKKKPLGIFTERDLVKVANRNIPFSNQTISDLMTHPVLTIPGNLSLYEAYNLMLTNNIRHHVVVDQTGRLVGVMSQSDLINHLGLEYFVEMRKVEQIMSTRVTTVGRELPVSAVLERMAGAGISCVVVEKAGFPLGILTERDAVRLVADGINPTTIQAGTVMSAPVVSVLQGATVHKAAQIMKQERIRRVVVVDSAGKIAGLITQSDIVKGLEGKYIESLKEIIREKEDLFQQTARELVDKTIYLDNILSSSIDMAIVATDSDLKVKYFNPVAERVFGHSADAVIGRSAMEMHELAGIAPTRLNRAREIVRKKLKYTFTAEIRQYNTLRYYDGSLNGILDRQKKLVGYVLMLRDITEQRLQEQTIHHMAYHDALTGLPNRLLLNDRLTQALATASRYSQHGALMILDLDRFKDINDTLGHSTGDCLLQAVAERLCSLLRKSDTVARMGGDEFVLLLPNLPRAESATLIARKIVKAFRTPFDCTGHQLTVTTSIGIADFPGDGMDAENLIKKADIALYRVKEGGRDNFTRYSATPS